MDTTEPTRAIEQPDVAANLRDEIGDLRARINTLSHDVLELATRLEAISDRVAEVSEPGM